MHAYMHMPMFMRMCMHMYIAHVVHVHVVHAHMMHMHMHM